ncbi:MAG: TlpA disulfide reductase family protein [Thioalkalispiraceae bacterium]|jgi:thiol-disulfide isomerase/thioredoxin
MSRFYHFVLFLLLPLLPLHAEEALTLATDSGEEISVTVHGAKGERLFIWLPSEAGPQRSEQTSAEQLAANGIEVWRVNLLEDYFLPVVASSMERIPASAISSLIQFARDKTGKQVYLVTTGRGAIPVLRGAHHWQQQFPGQPGLGGAILLSPKFFIETPDPGEEGKLMPIVKATNLPLFIIQPNKSPWFWKLDKTVPALQQAGSDVYVRRLGNVRDRFNFRPDATAYEKQLADKLPIILRQASKLLIPYAQQPRQVAGLQDQAPQIRIGKKDRRLQVYKGDPVPPELRLHDLNDQVIDLKNLKGQVVLVNFWASWCPPCVHEMPSMQRLQESFKHQPFTILGVNMAEDKQTIKTFLQTKVAVDFPIILDKDGAALKRWGVFAFPTSYVIDKQGHIRYALFGGIEWDTPQIVNTISSLLNH